MELKHVPVPIVTNISAITLRTSNMDRSVKFYKALGFEKLYGGISASFTSFSAGSGYVNLIYEARTSDLKIGWWGRVIFYVSDVDAIYNHAVANDLSPDFKPQDAEWGERYFHITDPEGHELSFAKLL